MLDFAVYDLHQALTSFFDLFHGITKRPVRTVSDRLPVYPHEVFWLCLCLVKLLLGLFAAGALPVIRQVLERDSVMFRRICYFTAKGKTPVNATGAKGETEPSNLNAIAEGKEDGSVGVNHINHKITPTNDLD